MLGAVSHEELMLTLQLVFNLHDRKDAKTKRSLTHKLVLIQRNIKIPISPRHASAAVALVVFYFKSNHALVR